MRKLFTFLPVFLLSVLLFAQQPLSSDYTQATKILDSQFELTSEFIVLSSFETNLSEPWCSRDQADVNAFFEFSMPEDGRVGIVAEFADTEFFGLSLYHKENGEYVEFECNAYRGNTGYMNVYPNEELNLAGQTVLARIWGKDDINYKKVAIEINSGITEAYNKNTLTVLPNEYTPEELVLDVLISGCVEAMNIQYTGHNDAIGYFSNAQNLIGIEDGIIMASGNVITALGPNISGSSGTNLGQPGDALLQSLVNGTTYDAAILQFDFIPASEEVEFRYVFASDEYPEYAGSSFNDVFAFFISGGSENYNNYNIARLPGTTTPVTINNVNDFTNSQYYVSNWSPSNINIEYDGFTVVLTAMAAVTPCETYTMRLGVADVADGIYDSAVFLEAGSFFSGASVQADNLSGVGTDNDIWEGCSNTYLISLVEGADNSQDIIIDVEIDQANSTAVEGEDFSPFPEQITIPAGETSVSFDYEAYDIEDGDIFFIVSFFTSCPCGNIPADPIIDTIWIYDFEFVKGGIQDITTLYCGADAPAEITLEGKTNLDPEISYLWCNGETGPFATYETNFGATTYYLTMSDVCGNELYDDITILISDIDVAEQTVTPPACNGACNGSFLIEMNGSFTPFVYRYANENLVYLPDSVHVTGYNNLTHLCPANYKLTITDQIGCFIRMDFSIPNPPPIAQAPGLMDNDMDFCEDPGEIVLTAATNQPTPIYQWSTGATSSTITINPTVGEHDIWVRVIDGCGNYKEDEIQIRYSDIDIDVTTELDNGECDGTAAAFATNGIWPYNYWWEAPISSFNPNQDGLCTGYYTIKVTDAINCVKTEEIFIEEYNYVPQNSYNDVFLIYPNPSAGEFIIEYKKQFGSNVEIRITDINGRIVEYIKPETEKVFIEGIRSGVYFVELYYDEIFTGVQKLVITN